MDPIVTRPMFPVPVAPDWPARASEGDPAALAEAAREFEAILLRQMLDGLRQLFASDSEEDDGFGSDALFDTIQSELARHLSAQGGLGLADRLIEASAERTVGGDGRLAPLAGAAPERVVAVSVGTPRGRGAAATTAAPFGSAVTSRYGWRTDPIDGTPRFHAGVDVRAAFGVEVPAVRGGRVTFVGEQSGYGLTVVVDHGQGTTSRYAHLSALLVRGGEQIGTGYPIGRVGQSGRATGPHLHFEMTQDGHRVDPGVASVEMSQVRFDASDRNTHHAEMGTRSSTDPVGAE